VTRRGRAAAFLDRDGTIIEERAYLADPDGVELLPGSLDALRLLARAGYALVVVTNQSGIARGLYTEADFCAVQARLNELAKAAGVRFDAVFHCPHHPDLTGPCDCRKPGLGMYQAAARRLDIDLAASVYVGDRLADVLPALALGGRGFLVRTGYGNEQQAGVPGGVQVVDDLLQVARVLAGGQVDTRMHGE
jgi:D-glycero-D-manno-heptose 1,7-bisphosphate phosphatase